MIRESGYAPPPTHHVPEETLVEYVAGTARAGAALAVACHLSLCPDCRTRVLLLEAVGGAWLAGGPDELAAAPAEAMQAHALEGALAHLDDVPAASPPTTDRRGPQASALLEGYHLPAPLLQALAEVSAPRWRFLVPGVRAIDLPLAHDESIARLVKLTPGMKIPLHDHGGAELTLIFTGALSDDLGVYARGDLSFRVPGQRHVQRVSLGDECVALQVNEGPMKPLTLLGQLLRLVVRD